LKTPAPSFWTANYSDVLLKKASAKPTISSFDGNEIRGLEQNPDTKSRWAQLARSGRRVMQFLSEGRYVANVVDGRVTLYGSERE